MISEMSDQKNTFYSKESEYWVRKLKKNNKKRK